MLSECDVSSLVAVIITVHKTITTGSNSDKIQTYVFLYDKQCLNGHLTATS